MAGSSLALSRHDATTARRQIPRRAWYLLDNTARAFPAMIGARFTTVFRLSVRLQRPVEPAALQRATSRAYRRMPIFRVRLRRGVFWHFLEECDRTTVLGDEAAPCMWYPRHDDTLPLVRVCARNRRIAVEASHVVTDGVGALAFLRYLVVAYCEECGHHDAKDATELWRQAVAVGVPAPGEQPPRESEYAGRAWVRERIPRPDRYPRSWHIDGVRLARGRYRATTLRYPTDQLKTVAADVGGGVGDFLIAALMFVLQERFHAGRRRRRHHRPIRVLVPVNLRPATESATLRNFFVSAFVEIDQRLGRYELPELVGLVHHQLRAQLDHRSLKRSITRNVRTERSPWVRSIPVVAKNVLVRRAYKRHGEGINTLSFSNLGRVGVPDALRTGVRDFDFLPPPSPYTGVNATAITSGNTTSISFGSLLVDHDLERCFAVLLSHNGLTGELTTNWVA